MSFAAHINRVLAPVTSLSGRRKASKAVGTGWGGKAPRRATLAALKELKKGKGKRFSSTEELYEDLGI